jgi:RNA polymerase sigma-54 factor
MSMLQRQSQSQRLQQRADPQLLLTNRLLQMSSLELQQCLAQELSENPALESLDEQTSEMGDLTAGSRAEGSLSAFRPGSGEGEGFRSSAQERHAAGEDEVDPFAFVEAPQTLQDHLLAQLGAAAPSWQMRIGRYLIANMDPDGYLRCNEEEAARVLSVSQEEVEDAIRLIQTFDPCGVGARSLQECLLIQARSLAGEAQAPTILEPLLDLFWKDLVSSRLPLIARKLRVPVKEVEETVRWLRSNLSPYPGDGYRTGWEKNSHRSRPPVRPDVTLALSEGGELLMELPREELPAANVNPQYARLWQQMRDQPDLFSSAERQHVRDYLLRAQMFLKSLQDRGTILRRVAECVVSEQEQYLRTEREEDMAPLTQSQIASFLQVHESTVSRAVADKYLQLPSGRLVPLSYFFDRALSYRKLVANVVAAEDPASPYSDQEISDILRRQGISIARRTVMKYREEMNILSSRQRSRACA